jgi:hypothetical protein
LKRSRTKAVSSATSTVLSATAAVVFTVICIGTQGLAR